MSLAKQDDRDALGTPEAPDPIASEALVVRHAKRFDLAALFDVLSWLGYREDEIELRSHDTTLQQSAVVESVHFQHAPRKRVIVTLNLGWLASQSALPNYFRKILDEQQGQSATEFLGFFAHLLLSAGYKSSFPEQDRFLFSDWNRARAELRSLLGIRSLSTIHWVFAMCFPEMETAVQRAILLRTLRTRGMVLGEWSIGDGTSCGGLTEIPVSGVGITLICNEPASPLGVPWASEATRRLREDVFPVLAAHGLFLRILLVIRDQQSFMILQPDQFLGYEPISSASLPKVRLRKNTRTVVLWNGEVPT